jgi:beta-phosphoglucomutase-like phosphatase (HAD superfamily)
MSGVDDAVGAAPGRAAPGCSNLCALIFDVDGTLADTEEAHRQAFNQAFCAFGLTWSWTPSQYARLLQVTGGKERIAAHVDSLELDGTERKRFKGLIPEIHAAKTRYYKLRVGLGRVRPRAGVGRLMKEARAAGLRLGIASTTSPQNIEALLTAGFGPDAPGWFDVIVAGDAVEKKKPAPDVYVQVLARLHLPAANAVAIEDSEIGMRAAQAAGIFTLVTPSSWTRAQDFSSADLVLPSLADPEYPFDAAEEIRLGARYLGLAQLCVAHAAARRRFKDTQCKRS